MTRIELIDFLNFRDKMFWREIEFTENDQIVDAYLKSINSASIEARSIQHNEVSKEFSPGFELQIISADWQSPGKGQLFVNPKDHRDANG
jgi:hypothetical protein